MRFSNIDLRILLVAFFVGWTSLCPAEPTEQRLWTSTNGKTVEGRVLGIKEGKAKLQRADGPMVAVPLNAFIPADREFLKKHFEAAAGGVDLQESGAMAATGLPHPQGEIVGPIEAEKASHYMLYLPKTLKEGRKAPLLFYSNSIGGGRNVLKPLVDAAELGGWILAVSMESTNKLGYPKSTAVCEDAVEHLLETLPVDPDRVCFTGGSGGGAQALENSSVMKASGVMHYVTYVAAHGKPDADDYYIIGGGADLNRYCTADSLNELGRGAVLRFHPGGHTGPRWMMEDGMIWMNGRFLSRNRNKYRDAALDYETSLIIWLGTLKTKEPHRAYATARFLKDDYKISGNNAEAVDALIRELGADNKNVRYYEGLEAVETFGKKKLAKLAVKGKTPRGHVDPKIEKAATELAEEYSDVPVIEATFKAMAGPTK